MSIDETIGYYTYRSFLDEPVGTPDDLLFGEGELLLQISDEGGVTGTLAFPAQAALHKSFMDLEGTLTSWNPLTLHFLGKGRAGSAIADYEYEYDCRVAHDWDSSSPPQRRTLVGTVRRNKDHGSAKAGVTASFIAVQRDFVEPRSIPGVALIPEAVAMLGSRVHRLRHTVWHSIRGDWFSANMTDADRERIRKLGWYLDDPPFHPGGALNLTNGAGEDFLYMHRRMIRMVHEVYDRAGQPRPASWTQLPPANAPQFAYREVLDPANPALKSYVYDPDNSGVMVPPPTAAFLEQVRDPVRGINPFFRFNKTPRGLTTLMRNMAANLRNPRVLSQLSFGAYGNLIEFTVHNWMHMRWATEQPRNPDGTPAIRPPYDIDPKWDVPENDYLGDFHSSHVNPVFWKLHGWVDDCIREWEAAHNAAHPGQLQPQSVRGIPWFAPGPWVLKSNPFDWPETGDAHDHHDHSHAHHGQAHHGTGHHSPAQGEEQTLEQVMAILKEVAERPAPASGVIAGFAAAAHPARGLSGFARFAIPDELLE